MTLLKPEGAARALVKHGLIQSDDPVVVTPLGGGVSNIVLKAETATEAYVFKQALPRLKVEEEWLADASRLWLEVACLEVLDEMLPKGSVPRVVLTDREAELFAMTCAPDDMHPWKEELLEGRVRPEVAEAVGVLLRQMQIKSGTVWKERCRSEFDDTGPFVQLRIDPYLRFTASRHPDVAPGLERQANALLTRRTVLVHGDFSPKNILVNSKGEVMLLDCEVAHWGDAAFDPAFCLNHLCLKALYHALRHSPPPRSTASHDEGASELEPFIGAIRLFWRGYTGSGLTDSSETNQAPWGDEESSESFESRVIQQLGCLMLARVDGKSPVEYITHSSSKQKVRTLAKGILRDHTLSDVMVRLQAAL